VSESCEYLPVFDRCYNGGIEMRCENCNQRRTLNDAGLCHECEQAEREAAVIVDENGDEWTPGGYGL
jgi:hypothetical protein